MRKTAIAIICFNKKILFFQRDNIPAIRDPNKWQFPGGYVEGGESSREAIRREMRCSSVI